MRPVLRLLPVLQRLTAGAGAAVVATTVGDAVGAWVATGVFVPLPVQPANSIAQMSNAARLRVMISTNSFLHSWCSIIHLTRGIKHFFAINYTNIYT